MDRNSKNERMNRFRCEIYLARFEMYLYIVTCPCWHLVLLWWVVLRVNFSMPFNNAHYSVTYSRNTIRTEVHVQVSQLAQGWTSNCGRGNWHEKPSDT